MAPWPSGTASCMNFPRDCRARMASAKLITPAAAHAAYSPSEWPAAICGSTPRDASTRYAAMDTAKIAGWVNSVCFNCSAGPSKHSFESE